MKELKKHTLSLVMISLLVVIKFILIPVFEWQDGLVSNIQNKNKRLTKINNVLSNNIKTTEDNSQLSENLVKAESFFFPSQSESSFKLAQQQAFEKLMGKHNVKSSNVGWQTTTIINDMELKRYQVNIRFEGALFDVIAMYTELEGLSPWLEIENFNIPMNNKKNDSLGYIKGGRVAVNLYMHSVISQKEAVM